MLYPLSLAGRAKNGKWVLTSTNLLTTSCENCMRTDLYLLAKSRESTLRDIYEQCQVTRQFKILKYCYDRFIYKINNQSEKKPSGVGKIQLIQLQLA